MVRNLKSNASFRNAAIDVSKGEIRRSQGANFHRRRHYDLEDDNVDLEKLGDMLKKISLTLQQHYAISVIIMKQPFAYYLYTL